MRHYKDILKEAVVPPKNYEDYLGEWINETPRNYAKTLINSYGEPDSISSECAVWHNRDGFSKVVVKDEMIKHEFPSPHWDYVYSTRTINVPEELYDEFAKVTGSIIIDGLKQEVSARCGGVSANAVTLGFVEDVIRGKAEPSKDEYARRINNSVVPEWYQDLTHALKEDEQKDDVDVVARAQLPYDHPRKKSILKEPPVTAKGDIDMKKVKEVLKQFNAYYGLNEAEKIINEMCGKKHVEEVENDIEHVPEENPEKHMDMIKKDIAEIKRLLGSALIEVRLGNPNYKKAVKKTLNEWGVKSLRNLTMEMKIPFFRIVEEKGEEYKGKEYATDKEGYQKYFRDMMKRQGIKSIADLSDKEKAVFFKKVERGWQSEPGEEARGPKRNVEDPLEKKRGN